MGICIGRSNFKKINPVINTDSEKDKKNNNNNDTSKISKDKNKTTTRNKNNINTDEESLPKNIDDRDDSSNNIEVILNSKEKSSNNNNNNNDRQLSNKISSFGDEINNNNNDTNKENIKNVTKINKSQGNNTPKMVNSFTSENKYLNHNSFTKNHNLAVSLKSTHKLPIKDINAFKGSKELNITLIGNEETGKSAFMIKVTNNLFEKVYVPTIEQECSSKKFTYNNEEFTINFFVTSGNKQYQGDYSKIFTESAFILVFYDTSVEGSFDEAKNKLRNELKDYSYKYFDKFSNFIFVGNKIDIFPKRENNEAIRKYCKKKNFDNFEISVKTGKGIKELMDSLYEKFYQLTKGI
jgi:small GTP-binding protein